ncbi:hypothetical protein SFRURICE_014236, partial [Spodoptera frugiperda]
CLFGKQAMELGSKWFADLGPPFGVMYCIKCECVAVQKKRRVVAKVHCRNIKNECPEPSCDTPVLLPGRCCKTCPGDLNLATDSDLRGAQCESAEAAGRGLSRSGDVADAASARPRPLITTISRALQWHYSDAPGGGAEMARAGPPCARAAAANIAAAAGYSGLGRRPVAATPSARLFSEHNLQHTFFANKYR